jgi:DNA repair protein RadC
MGVHEGHRSRLKQRFEAEGLDSFQPHEALELLLFQPVARRDVNPLAHELIDRFGSLSGVLSAGAESLCEAPGVNRRTAALLSYLPEFFECYRDRRAADRPQLKNLGAARDYCQRLMEGSGAGRLWLMHLSGTGGLLLAESLPTPGGYPRPRQVVERALVSRAQALVMASGRENARLQPEDKAFASALTDLLPMIGVTLLDALLLDGDNTVSFRREGLLAAPLREPGSSLRLMERRWLWEEEGAGGDAEGNAGAPPRTPPGAVPLDPAKGEE